LQGCVCVWGGAICVRMCTSTRVMEIRRMWLCVCVYPGYQRWKGTMPAPTPGMCFFLRQSPETPGVTQIAAIAPGPEDKRKLPMGALLFLARYVSLALALSLTSSRAHEIPLGMRILTVRHPLYTTTDYIPFLLRPTPHPPPSAGTSTFSTCLCLYLSLTFSRARYPVRQRQVQNRLFRRQSPCRVQSAGLCYPPPSSLPAPCYLLVFAIPSPPAPLPPFRSPFLLSIICNVPGAILTRRAGMCREQLSSQCPSERSKSSDAHRGVRAMESARRAAGASRWRDGVLRPFPLIRCYAGGSNSAATSAGNSKHGSQTFLLPTNTFCGI
jgi:hypothetical protein